MDKYDKIRILNSQIISKNTTFLEKRVAQVTLVSDKHRQI